MLTVFAIYYIVWVFNTPTDTYLSVSSKTVFLTLIFEYTLALTSVCSLISLLLAFQVCHLFQNMKGENTVLLLHEQRNTAAKQSAAQDLGKEGGECVCVSS